MAARDLAMPYHGSVELASNLVWMIVAASILGGTVWTLRRDKTKLSPASALMLACLVSLVLLPAISISDDLLEAHQAALPASSQTWRMASEGASVWLEVVPVFCAFLMLLAFLALQIPLVREAQWATRPQSAWLMRSLRLRPPPSITL